VRRGKGDFRRREGGKEKGNRRRAREGKDEEKGKEEVKRESSCPLGPLGPVGIRGR
jgi:hypothetical protein